MIKLRNFLSIVLISGISLLLHGCNLVILNPKGSIAADEKNILIISVLLMLLVVIPVIIMAFVFAWRYRESNTNAKYEPDWSHNTTLEVVWWTIPCIIIGILGTITWISTHRLDPYQPLSNPQKPITIQAISLEWKWLFIYPEENIATINYIQFPVNTPIRFLISAEGPMNSFQIPALAGQIYAMAGMQTKLHLITDVVGEYQGQSTNFTGDGFSFMNFKAIATSKADYDKWVQTVKNSSDNLTMMSYNELIKPSINVPVTYFSSANKNIFETVVMKSMMPMPMEGMEEQKQQQDTEKEG